MGELIDYGMFSIIILIIIIPSLMVVHLTQSCRFLKSVTIMLSICVCVCVCLQVDSCWPASAASLCPAVLFIHLETGGSQAARPHSYNQDLATAAEPQHSSDILFASFVLGLFCKKGERHMMCWWVATVASCFHCRDTFNPRTFETPRCDLALYR